MTSKSALYDLSPQDRAAYGYGRVRNAAFEAVQKLWRRRKANGMTQIELGQRINMDPARVSKYFRGPGNWTLQTFGELVEGLDGEVEIVVHAVEDPIVKSNNSDAYSGYELPIPPPPPIKPKTSEGRVDLKPEMFRLTTSGN